MEILAVTQSKDIFGGANRSMLAVLRRLRDSYGHHITVIAPGRGQFTEELEKINIPYYLEQYKQISYVTMHDWKDPARYARSTLYDIRNLIAAKMGKAEWRKRQYDAVYINDTTNVFGYYLAKALGIPFVWHFRGYHETIRHYSLFDSEINRTKYGKVICISHAMESYMHQYRGMDYSLMTVVYNGVENPNIEIVQPWHETVKNRELHCIHCGHISTAKGQMDSVQAIVELKKRGYDQIYLHLAGTPAIIDGQSYDCVLKKVIRDAEIEDQVIFEGEVKNMPELRSHMQVELMCSLAEPFGRVTVEGLQAGLVVIGADTGATPEIITDGTTGLIYQQGNPCSLADRIESVYTDSSLGDRLSRNALEFSKTHFTMERNVAEINDVLMSAIGEKQL